MLALRAEYLETGSLSSMEARRSNPDGTHAPLVLEKSSCIGPIPAFYPMRHSRFVPAAAETADFAVIREEGRCGQTLFSFGSEAVSVRLAAMQTASVLKVSQHTKRVIWCCDDLRSRAAGMTVAVVSV
jgi:hypothetical protein